MAKKSERIVAYRVKRQGVYLTGFCYPSNWKEYKGRKDEVQFAPGAWAVFSQHHTDQDKPHEFIGPTAEMRAHHLAYELGGDVEERVIQEGITKKKARSEQGYER